ncbi:F0F1 ATP synthase subunit B family protein [Hephaestia mangrovi]|uniref:F0F1 ATP synthase subunit B family protein n=1 Tax=Hephaestia mangrovi TaxID=2873268 RepID=UPI001CA780DA|nr:ATPase [Hephaestia mangrovi]MBY8829612.1 ATPase [Hephaestia mangrovi]
MPQLTQLAIVYQSQWFWLLITLAVIFFAVGRGIVPKVEATVDQRDAKIEADLAAAEQARQDADATEERWRSELAKVHADAQAAANEARGKAGEEAAARLAAADAELQAKTAEANAKLATARDAALAAIESVAADAARDIVGKVSGASVTAAEADKAVKAALAHG